MIGFPIHTTSMSLRSGLELLFCLNQTVSPAAHKADEFRAQSQHPTDSLRTMYFFILGLTNASLLPLTGERGTEGESYSGLVQSFSLVEK